jgi:hypothetical protein
MMMTGYHFFHLGAPSRQGAPCTDQPMRHGLSSASSRIFSRSIHAWTFSFEALSPGNGVRRYAFFFIFRS